MDTKPKKSRPDLGFWETEADLQYDEVLATSCIAHQFIPALLKDGVAVSSVFTLLSDELWHWVQTTRDNYVQLAPS